MKKLRGFTVVEIIVGLGLFVVLTSASSLIFTRLFRTHRSSVSTQKSIQDAQFALNVIAKTLRTSTILSPSPGNRVSLIKAFDNSQARCIEYQFNSGTKTVETRVATGASTRDDCAVPNPFLPGENFQVLFGGTIIGSFTYTASNGDPLDETNWRVGRVTISLELDPPGGAATPGDTVRIQTSVSLRDYMEFQYNAFSS